MVAAVGDINRAVRRNGDAERRTELRAARRAVRKTAGACARERSGCAERRRSHAWNCFETSQQLLICAGQFFGIVSAARWIDSPKQYVIPLEAQIEMAEIRQVANKQTSRA